MFGSVMAPRYRRGRHEFLSISIGASMVMACRCRKRATNSGIPSSRSFLGRQPKALISVLSILKEGG
jgi:hypothetical protein